MKTLLLLALLVSSTIAFSHKVKAQEEISLDSIVIPSEAVFDGGYGIGGYKDTYYATRDSIGDIIATSSSYTILSVWIGGNGISSPSDSPQFHCSDPDVWFPADGGMRGMANSLSGSLTHTFQRDGEWHCTGNLYVTSGSNFWAEVQYVPYDTRMVSSTPVIIDWTDPIIIAGFWTAIAAMVIVIWIFKKRI